MRKALPLRLQAAADPTETSLRALSAIFRAHVDFVMPHPGVPRFIFHELQQPTDSAAKLEVRAVLQRYRKLLLGRSSAMRQQADVLFAICQPGLGAAR